MGDILCLSSVQKITSGACLDRSGLKDIFYLLAQRLTLSISLFSFNEVLIGSLTTESIEVSSTKSFSLGSRLSDKSLIHIKKQWTTNQILRNTSFNCKPFRFLPFRLFVVFRTKKIQSKLEDHPLHPYILSYK